jgi:HPt (histidine-containing phosphotransfer) domain-containing protein
MDFKEMGEKLGLEEDEFKELVDLFMETGQSDYATITQAIQDGELAKAARAAHTLAGAAGNLGLMDIHQIAKQIELQANENRTGGLAEVAGKISAMFDQISASMS